jgi:hypothetical protein
MNLNFIVSRAITPIYPIVQVQLYTFASQNNVLGIVTPTYNAPITVDANIQFTAPERLRYINGYNKTSIYKDFWINSETLTGLNRNISAAGDYLIFGGLKYKVVGVDEKFRVNWALLTCVQSEDSNE